MIYCPYYRGGKDDIVAATARLTVLLEPAQKAVIQSHARAARISTDEYVKRAVTAYDAFTELDAETMVELEANAVLLESATKEMTMQIDASIAKIDRVMDPAHIAEERSRIEREVREMPFDRLAFAQALGFTAGVSG